MWITWSYPLYTKAYLLKKYESTFTCADNFQAWLGLKRTAFLDILSNAFLMFPRVMVIGITTYLISCFTYIISEQTVTFDLLESHLLLVYVLWEKRDLMIKNVWSSDNKKKGKASFLCIWLLSPYYPSEDYEKLKGHMSKATLLELTMRQFLYGTFINNLLVSMAQKYILK